MTEFNPTEDLLQKLIQLHEQTAYDMKEIQDMQYSINHKLNMQFREQQKALKAGKVEDASTDYLSVWTTQLVRSKTLEIRFFQQDKDAFQLKKQQKNGTSATNVKVEYVGFASAFTVDEVVKMLQELLDTDQHTAQILHHVKAKKLQPVEYLHRLFKRLGKAFSGLKKEAAEILYDENNTQFENMMEKDGEMTCTMKFDKIPYGTDGKVSALIKQKGKFDEQDKGKSNWPSVKSKLISSGFKKKFEKFLTENAEEEEDEMDAMMKEYTKFDEDKRPTKKRRISDGDDGKKKDDQDQVSQTGRLANSAFRATDNCKYDEIMGTDHEFGFDRNLVH